MSDSSPLHKRIRETQLSRDQQRIAQRVTSALHRVAFLSGAELAAECDVSVSAITRFAQRLGYAGFPALKSELEQLYRQTTTPYEVFESFRQERSEASVAERTWERDLQNIASMRAQLDGKTLERAVKAIAKAKKVHLAAIASAEALVDLAHAYLDALHVSTECHKGLGLTKRAEVMDFDKGELLIGFSFQRVLREVRDLFVYVRERGVKTLAITDSPMNALAAEADTVLIAPVIGTTFGLSHTAPLTLLNVLVNSVAAYDADASAKALEHAKGEWQKRPIFCDALEGAAGER